MLSSEDRILWCCLWLFLTWLVQKSLSVCCRGSDSLAALCVRGGEQEAERGQERDNEKETGWTLEEETEQGVWKRMAARDRQVGDHEKRKGGQED